MGRLHFVLISFLPPLLLYILSEVHRIASIFVSYIKHQNKISIIACQQSKSKREGKKKTGCDERFSYFKGILLKFQHFLQKKTQIVEILDIGKCIFYLVLPCIKKITFWEEENCFKTSIKY